jgi:cell division septum initiation protein DivIVA
MITVQHIEAKIKLLAGKYEQQKADNERQRLRIEFLEEELQDKTLQIAILSQQNTALQAARKEEEQIKLKLRKDIDQHLREINKCIEWLQES